MIIGIFGLAKSQQIKIEIEKFKKLTFINEERKDLKKDRKIE
jgi:hypothetical protein